MNDIIKEINYYIIEVKGKGRCYYKIGEGTVNRPKQLVKKYRKLRDIDAKVLQVDVLPHNHEKRLNDKTIHKSLSKLNRVDHLIIEGLLHETDGSNEFFEITKDYPSIDVVDYVKEVVDELKENPANFKIKNAFIDNVKLVYTDDDQKHQINSALIDIILNFGKISLYNSSNKNILLIGQFLPDWVSTFALYSSVYIWHDSESEKHIYKYTDLNKHITYIKDLRELLEMNKDFDLIIANPPYNIGNKITKAIIDDVDFKKYINLMPISCYKKDIYNHVESLQLVDPKLFTDAIIPDNLNIANISKDELDKTWEDVELLTYDEKYRKFYELNNHCFNYAISSYERVPQRAGIKWDYDVNKAFAITARTALDGVHDVNGKGAFDLDVNVYKTKTIADTAIWKHSNGKDAQAAASYIYFNSEVEKKNLIRFWYYNPLMNDLIKGLHKTGGDFKLAIPNIDWSKDRDYEHITYDELLDILKNE